jgi:hypothetical protein
MECSCILQKSSVKDLYEYPIANIPIIEPKDAPQAGEVLLGYELLYAKHKFNKPNPRHMNAAGWISVVLLTLFFWPAALVPCFTKCSYNECQRPVYGSRMLQARSLSQEVVPETPDVSIEPQDVCSTPSK